MSESGHSDLRLPSLATNESKSASIAASLWGLASEKPWRSRMVGSLVTQSVLSSKGTDFEHLPRVLGGPPRNPKAASGAVSLVPIIPIEETTRKLGRWPEKPSRKPIQPRMALRRAPEIAALTDGNAPSQPSKPFRPPSPVAFAEVVYTCEQLGKNAGLWRGDEFDEELQGRNEELAEFARHRLEITQATQELSRKRAIQWRARKELRDNIFKISWTLRDNLPGKPPPLDLLRVEDEEVDPERLHPKNVSFTESLMTRESALHEEVDFIFNPILETSIEADSFEPEYTDCVPPPTPLAKSGEAEGVQPEEEKKKGLMKRLVTQQFVVSALKTSGRSREVKAKKNSSLRRKMRKARSKVMDNMDHIIEITMEDVEKELHEKPPEPELDEEEERMKRYLAEHNLQTDLKLMSEWVQAMATISYNDSQAYRIVWKGFCGDENLDQADLLPFLGAIGFKPKNDIERKALMEVVSVVDSLEVDWVAAITTIIPEVRVALAKTRLPMMLHLFQQADADNSGTLSIMELFQIMRRGGYAPDMPKIVEAVVEHVPGANDVLRNISGTYMVEKNIMDLSQFLRMAPVLIERFQRARVRRRQEIIQEFDIDEEKQEIWGPGLVDLRDAFTKRLESTGGLMPVSLLHYVAMDAALLTRRGSGFREKLYKLAKAEIERRHMEYHGRAPTERSEFENAVLDFGQVLRIMTTIRRQECDRIRRVFEEEDCDNTNGLSLSECIDCLAALGTVAQSKKETKLIDEMMEEYDEDESGELDIDEFSGMVKFVADGIRKMRRSEIIDKASDLGYDEDQFDAIDDAFTNADWNLDHICEESEVHVGLRALRPNWEFSGQDVDLVLHDLGLKRLTSGHRASVMRAKVGLWDFIQILKAIDEQKAHREVGAKLGLDREAIDFFETLWKVLKPTKEGHVSPKELQKALKKLPNNTPKISRLKDLMDNGLTEVDFSNFLLVMRRGYEKPVRGKTQGTSSASGEQSDIPLKQAE